MRLYTSRFDGGEIGISKAPSWTSSIGADAGGELVSSRRACRRQISDPWMQGVYGEAAKTVFPDSLNAAGAVMFRHCVSAIT